MVKGCSLKWGLGLIDLLILLNKRVGEWLVFEDVVVVAEM